MPPKHLDFSQIKPEVNGKTLNNSSAALSSSTGILTHINFANATKDKVTPDQQTDQGQKKSLFSKVSDTEGDISTGVAKGIFSTLKGASKIGRNIANFFLPKSVEIPDVNEDKNTISGKLLNEENLTPKNTAESIGKGAEQTAEFFIPAGEINKVQKVLSEGVNVAERLTSSVGAKAAKLIENSLKTGIKMGVRAGEGGGIIGLQSGGDAEQTKEGAKYGAILSGAGSLISPALKKVLSPFKGSFDATTKDFFESEGIKAPVSALSKNKGVQNLEAVASKTLFGGDINKIAKDAVDTIETKTNKIIEGLKPTKSMSDENLGKMLQTGLNDYETHFKQTEDKVYEAYSKKYGNAPARPMSTQAELGSILSQQGEDIFKGKDKGLVNMFNRMTEETPEIKSFLKDAKEQGLPQETVAKEIEKMKAGQPPFEMTFSQLKNTRTSVGEELSKDPQNAALKRLYGALSRDMEDAVSFDDTAKDSLAKINAQYKAGKDKIESRIAQSVIMSNPEKIADNIIQRNSADTVNQLKEMVGPERFKEVSKHFVSNLVNKATTEGGKFKVDKLKAALGDYDQETLDAVLSKEEQKGIKEGIDQLEKLNLLSDATKAGSKAATGSQTAFLNNANITAGGLSAGIIQALTTGNFTVLGALTAKIGGEYALAKFIASDVGRKILTEGINPENIKLLSDLDEATRSLIVESVRHSSDSEQDE